MRMHKRVEGGEKAQAKGPKPPCNVGGGDGPTGVYVSPGIPHFVALGEGKGPLKLSEQTEWGPPN